MQESYLGDFDQDEEIETDETSLAEKSTELNESSESDERVDS